MPSPQLHIPQRHIIVKAAGGGNNLHYPSVHAHLCEGCINSIMDAYMPVMHAD